MTVDIVLQFTPYYGLPVTRFVQANYSKLVWARSDEGYEMEIVRNRVGGRGVISRVRDRGVDRRGRSI